LTWVSTEYPVEEAHLHQLSIVTSYPQRFPETPAHTKYTKPHEKTFIADYVNRQINEHLQNFKESAPSLHDAYISWGKRRDEHGLARQKALNRLNIKVRSQWDKGDRSLASDCVSDPFVSSSTSLAKNITALFERWEQARRLQDFVTKVSTQLGRMRSGAYNNILSVIDLDRDETMDCCSSRTFFVLKTRPNNDHLCELEAYQPEFPNAYTLQLTSSSNGSADCKRSRGDSKLDLSSNFIENNPEYKEIWDDLVGRLRESWELACRETDNPVISLQDLEPTIRHELNEYEKRANFSYERNWDCIISHLKLEHVDCCPVDEQVSVGLWDSINPYDVLLTHLNGEQENDSTFSGLLISFAMAVKHVQRARRCLRLLNRECTGSSIHLLNDLSNPGSCQSWSALDYPEFLLFEIDNDVCIREIQAKVAFEMLGLENECNHQAGTENRLLQLNMGGGKTAVIMPIVLAVAARGKKIVRATVLSSLYATNASDWQHKLGGLLNRRVYPMLCRRDLPIGKLEASILLETCKKIKREKHVLVTVPEHRLSLENKAIEFASKLSLHMDVATSKVLHKVVAFLSHEGRDFLDESDEILSPKYQLIYTMGAPCDMDGAQLRWAVHACIYESLSRHAMALQEKFGAEMIEILKGDEDTPSRPTEYVGVRLLEGCNHSDDANEDTKKYTSDDGYEDIKKCIIDDILCGQSILQVKLRPEEKAKWEKCVAGNGSGSDMEALPDDVKTLALCLRGVLAHNVLKVVLFKRWRVQYGDHPTRTRFQMAVPYRAKDVAAERTEFGHADVALSLTFAHYYQAGLSMKQLRDVFERLKRMSESEAKMKYRTWVAELPDSDKNGIASYEGVNIEDGGLFETKLFPVFRKHMLVIRFWLFKLILPIQAKQFPKKLLATAPDLCRSPQLCSEWQAITTGFSGTDDLSLLLPPTILQRNVKELEMTNGIQLRNLLRQENDHYSSLVKDNTAKEMLEKILARNDKDRAGSSSSINVVLDPGALVLQMSNRKFVEAWLKERPDMEAAAFFEGDSIFIVTQAGMLVPFGASPYCDDMAKCLLYLDDIHTRGSDFLLPLDTRAILTLGKGMPKDKFLQACMRMRQLGRGQSLTFVASHEVHLSLVADFGFHPTSPPADDSLAFVRGILNWTLSNTVKRICELMPYFATQMRSSLRKANAYNSFCGQSGDICVESLAEACIEDEVLGLNDLYGHQRGHDLLPKIVGRQLAEVEFLDIKLSSEDSPSSSDTARTEGAKMKIDHLEGGNLVAIADKIKERIKHLAPHVTLPCSMFDEEQERELEQELEEEVHVERPPPAIALKPHISEGLRTVLRKVHASPHNFAVLCKEHLQPLASIFRGTSHEVGMATQLKHCEVYVTKDFAETVKGHTGKHVYIKNIRWFLQWEDLPVIAVISNFEAEALSQLLASAIQRPTFSKRYPTLYSFAALTRLQQPRKFLTVSSRDPPAIVHVFGGSVHADGALLAEIRNFLALFPRPLRNMAEWDDLFNREYILRDGFVRPRHRARVKRLCGDDDFDGDGSPLRKAQ
jgi:hypothetical protein